MSTEQYYDPLETAAPEELAALQLERLRWTVAQAAQSPHYARLFSERGLSAETLRTRRSAPLPLHREVRPSRGYPFGQLAVPLSKVVRLHHSSGTTGLATAVLHSKTDIDNWADLVARSLYMAGLRSDDVFQNMMTYGLFTGGLGLHYGAERLGAFVIPMGAGNSHRQIEFMRTFKTTALHIIPSYALGAPRHAGGNGRRSEARLFLRFAIGGAEPYTEGARSGCRRLGIPLYNCYGLSRCAVPASPSNVPRRHGLHLWEDHYLAEISTPTAATPCRTARKANWCSPPSTARPCPCFGTEPRT